MTYANLIGDMSKKIPMQILHREIINRGLI